MEMDVDWVIYRGIGVYYGCGHLICAPDGDPSTRRWGGGLGANLYTHCVRIHRLASSYIRSLRSRIHSPLSWVYKQPFPDRVAANMRLAYARSLPLGCPNPNPNQTHCKVFQVRLAPLALARGK